MGKIGNSQILVEGSKRKARVWDKRDRCVYCDKDVTNFSRHLLRKHKDEQSVQIINSLPKGNASRAEMIKNLRKEGNFQLIDEEEIIRPVQRLKMENITGEPPSLMSEFLPCPYCKGIYRAKSLRKHTNKCNSNPDKQGKANVGSMGQNLLIFTGSKSNFLDRLRIKKEVFDRMHADSVSYYAKNDPVIVQYGDDYLKKHKRLHIRNTVANKVRELGRLLQQLDKVYNIKSMIEALDTKHFDKVVHSAHIITGYDPYKKEFVAPSLAMHMKTILLNACLAAKTLLSKRDPVLPVLDYEAELKKVKDFRNLVSERWKFDMGSLAHKDLDEKGGEKSANIPITSDVLKFRNYVLKLGEAAFKELINNPNDKKAYKNLSEVSMTMTILQNRRRIGDVTYTKLQSYNTIINQRHQEEFLQNLTEPEKILSSQFKRITTLGKGSKRVPILIFKDIRRWVDLLIETRANFIPPENPFLFAEVGSKDEWAKGSSILRKLAKNSGAQYPETLTSTRLRKQIAIVLQALNLSKGEREQLASFMGHTEKTHNEFYRLVTI